MENIKREDLAQKGYTEEQITEILNMYHKMGDEVKKANEGMTKSQSLADSLQKQIDDINKANMSEQEKFEQMKKEAELNLSNSKKIYNTAKAKEILAGYDIEDDLIKNLVSEDEALTINNANLLKSRFDTIIDNTTKKVQNNIASQDVKPIASNVPQEGGMTFEKFSELSADEQNKLLSENPDLMKNW